MNIISQLKQFERLSMEGNLFTFTFHRAEIQSMTGEADLLKLLDNLLVAELNGICKGYNKGYAAGLEAKEKQ